MRGQRVVAVAALTLSACSLLATVGCAPTDGAASPQAIAENYDGALEALRATPGVTDATFSLATSESDLEVTLDPRVTAAELAVIGDRVEALNGRADELSHPVHSTVLSLGASSYSYFAGLSGDALDAQLAYWHDLIAAGPESVVIADGSTTVSAAATLESTPPAATVVAGPRFVLIDLPEVAEASHLSTMLANLAAIDDPGAPSGQWRLVDLAPDTNAEFAKPEFPDRDRLASALDAGDIFGPIDVASVEVRQGPDDAAPLEISIVSFDESMDGIPAAKAEQHFERTDAYAQVTSLIDMLERRTIPAYEVSVLSSPLGDGGNFALRFGVQGCTFTGDSRWPALSEKLGEYWLEHVALQRYPGGEKARDCTVVVPTPAD